MILVFKHKNSLTTDFVFEFGGGRKRKRGKGSERGNTVQISVPDGKCVLTDSSLFAAFSLKYELFVRVAF